MRPNIDGDPNVESETDGGGQRPFGSRLGRLSRRSVLAGAGLAIGGGVIPGTTAAQSQNEHRGHGFDVSAGIVRVYPWGFVRPGQPFWVGVWISNPMSAPVPVTARLAVGYWPRVVHTKSTTIDPGGGMIWLGYSTYPTGPRIFPAIVTVDSGGGYGDVDWTWVAVGRGAPRAQRQEIERTQRQEVERTQQRKLDQDQTAMRAEVDDAPEGPPEDVSPGDPPEDPPGESPD